MKSTRIRESARRLAGQAAAQLGPAPRYHRAVLRPRSLPEEASGAKLRPARGEDPTVQAGGGFASTTNPPAPGHGPSSTSLAAGSYLTGPAMSRRCSDHPAPARLTLLRPGRRRLPPTDSCRVRHRRQLGHPTADRFPPHRPTRCGATQPGPAAAAGHRRGRLPALRRRRREPVLPARRITLREQLDHPHQQPALQSLGQEVFGRPGRRVRHDRPHRPPRRSHPAGHVLPAEEHHDHLPSSAAPSSKRTRHHQTSGSLFSRRKRSPIRPSLTTTMSSRPDRRRRSIWSTRDVRAESTVLRLNPRISD